MFLNPAMEAALDRITARADDVRRAFTPGSAPRSSDAASTSPGSDVTLDPLSVSAPADAYFLVRSADGRTAYTRNGVFSMRDGELVDAGGRNVLGISASGGVEPVRADPVDVALRRSSAYSIAQDGTLSYERTAIDPRTGARIVQRVNAGQLCLARFPAGSALASLDGTLLDAPAGVVPHRGLPGDGNFASLLPMRRERSHVDLDTSLVKLKEAYVAFDALQAAETARGKLSKTAMDLLK